MSRVGIQRFDVPGVRRGVRFGVGLDGCGVCGRDCSACTAAETGLPHDCEPPGRGWTGMDRTCTFVRTSGPDGPDDALGALGAFPNGTDGNGQKLPANEVLVSTRQSTGSAAV